MTTYFPFTPSTIRAPQFMPTFDNNVYSVSAIWNLFGQRYYLVCNDLNGNLTFNVPLVESASGITIVSAVWNVLSLNVTITTRIPHGYAIGSMFSLTISGMVPTTFNGTFPCLSTGPTTLSFQMPTNPGLAATYGSVSYIINMAAGYFASTLVFRNGQFEVNP